MPTRSGGTYLKDFDNNGSTPSQAGPPRPANGDSTGAGRRASTSGGARSSTGPRRGSVSRGVPSTTGPRPAQEPSTPRGSRNSGRSRASRGFGSSRGRGSTRRPSSARSSQEQHGGGSSSAPDPSLSTGTPTLPSGRNSRGQFAVGSTRQQQRQNQRSTRVAGPSAPESAAVRYEQGPSMEQGLGSGPQGTGFLSDTEADFQNPLTANSQDQGDEWAAEEGYEEPSQFDEQWEVMMDTSDVAEGGFASRLTQESAMVGNDEAGNAQEIARQAEQVLYWQDLAASGYQPFDRTMAQSPPPRPAPEPVNYDLAFRPVPGDPPPPEEPTIDPRLLYDPFTSELGEFIPDINMDDALQRHEPPQLPAIAQEVDNLQAEFSEFPDQLDPDDEDSDDETIDLMEPNLVDPDQMATAQDGEDMIDPLHVGPQELIEMMGGDPEWWEQLGFNGPPEEVLGPPSEQQEQEEEGLFAGMLATNPGPLPDDDSPNNSEDHDEHDKARSIADEQLSSGRASSSIADTNSDHYNRVNNDEGEDNEQEANEEYDDNNDDEESEPEEEEEDFFEGQIRTAIMLIQYMVYELFSDEICLIFLLLVSVGWTAGTTGIAIILGVYAILWTRGDILEPFVDFAIAIGVFLYTMFRFWRGIHGNY